MAPIEADRRCLEEKVLKLECEIKSYIQDIAENTTTLNDLNQLNLNVKRLLKDLQYTLNKYQLFGNEQEKETDKISILSQVNKFRKELEHTQHSLRKANLTCQLGLDKIAREKLFDQCGDDDLRQRRQLTREGAARTSAGITENLQRISQMMAAQVKHGEETTDKLVTSSSGLEGAHEEMKGHSGLIHISHRLLKKFGRREFTDKILIILAVSFFLACALYIIKKRLLPTW